MRASDATQRRLAILGLTPPGNDPPTPSTGLASLPASPHTQQSEPGFQTSLHHPAHHLAAILRFPRVFRWCCIPSGSTSSPLAIFRFTAVFRRMGFFCWSFGCSACSLDSVAFASVPLDSGGSGVLHSASQRTLILRICIHRRQCLVEGHSPSNHPCSRRPIQVAVRIC